MEQLTLSGLICIHDFGEASGILFLSAHTEPVASILHDQIRGKNVNIRYWITDKEATKEEAKADFIESISGKAETDYGSRYSDYTGYLWTDEECKIGGHDLIEEIKANKGKWLHLEIDILS
jgi:hypothetical protein